MAPIIQATGNMQAQRRRKRLKMWRAILLVVIAIALIQFLYRGPMRMGQAYDLAAIYAPAHAWLNGQNPYDADHVAAALHSAQYDGPALGDNARTAVYPPPTYLVMAPLAAMNWSVARDVWLAINLLAMALLTWQAVQLMRQIHPRLLHAHLNLALLAGVLLLAPYHTSFALGQTAIVATLLILVSFRASLAQHSILSGLLAGLAFALKPQMGVVALAYLIARFRWRASLIALLTIGMLMGLAVIQLQVHAPMWLADLRANMQTFNHGGVGDMSRHGPFTHQFLSIHTLLHRWLDDRTLVTVMAVALGAAVTLWAMRCIARHATLRDEVLFISILAVACLLTAPGQRFYSATLLVLPLVWVLSMLFGRRRWPVLPARGERGPFAVSGVALAAMMVFAIPGSALLFVLARDGHVPTMVTDTFLWRNVLLLQGVWALMVMLATLLALGGSSAPLRVAAERGRMAL